MVSFVGVDKLGKKYMQTVANGLYQHDKRELIYGIIYLIGTKVKKIQLHNKNQIKIFAF